MLDLWPTEMSLRRTPRLPQTSGAPQHLTMEHWRGARDMYQRSLNIIQDLRDRGILDVEEIPEIENVGRKVAECDTFLGR